MISRLIISFLMKTPTIPPVNLGFLLHDVARLLRRRFDQRAQEQGLTRAQWQVLAWLKHNEGIRQVGLADLMDVEPITLSRHIDRLEKAGMVARRPDPTDRRAYCLYLGDKVQPLLDQMRALGIEVFGEALAGIEPEEVDRLIAILSAMRTNLRIRTGTEASEVVPSPAVKVTEPSPS